MTAATIPELIEPGVLYVPDQYNFFTIASGDLPNTDDALEMTAAGWRGYQPAISGIHYPATTSDDFSVLFWYYSGGSNSSGGTAFSSFGCLMGVMDAFAAGSGSGITTTASTTGFAWGLCVTSTTVSREFHFHRAVGGSQRSASSGSQWAPPASTWAMATVVSTGVTGQCYIGNTPVASWSSGTPGTPGTLVDPYFGLGPFATTANWSSPYSGTLQNKIAKVSLWNRELTVPELTDLRDSMTSGPPSP